MLKFFLEITLLFFIICLISILAINHYYKKGDLIHPTYYYESFCDETTGIGYWFEWHTTLNYDLQAHKWKWGSVREFKLPMTDQEYKSCLQCKKHGYGSCGGI